MTAARSYLTLSVLVVILGTLVTPTFAFRAASSIGIKKHGASITLNIATRQGQHVHRRTTALHLSSPDQNPDNNKKVDPLIASLTRNDESTPTKTRTVPLFGEVTEDDFKALAPVVAIGVLGFLFSIVVAFNSMDSLGQQLSKVTIPEVKYTPTVVKEGECRGLCSNQDQDLDGLRNFMESISRKD